MGQDVWESSKFKSQPYLYPLALFLPVILVSNYRSFCVFEDGSGLGMYRVIGMWKRVIFFLIGCQPHMSNS